MAVDSALEAGVPLVLVNLIPLPFYVTTLVLLGPEGTDPAARGGPRCRAGHRGAGQPSWA